MARPSTVCNTMSPNFTRPTSPAHKMKCWDERLSESMFNSAIQASPHRSSSPVSVINTSSLHSSSILHRSSHSPKRDDTYVRKSAANLTRSFSPSQKGKSVIWGETFEQGALTGTGTLLNSSLRPASPGAPTYHTALSSTPYKDSSRPSHSLRKDHHASHRKTHRTELMLSTCSSGKDPRQQSEERIVGEIAFQLDRRILSWVFFDLIRLYGFTVSNIPQKIVQTSTNPLSGKVDESRRADMTRRYLHIMERLTRLGYHPKIHPTFSEYIVNTYGILRQRPELGSKDLLNYNDPYYLRRMIIAIVPTNYLKDCLLLLNCLQHLAKDDGKPLLIW
nr:PREDICTED: speriolin [Latimeria chalumnae]|eukprot:XP_014352075.1 PREDICTED: speriolin [Latimeria chalumnae]